MKKYIAIIFLFFMPSLALAENSEFSTRIINGHTFKVPKDYLWQGRNVPDGNTTKGIYILAEWPKMGPISLTQEGKAIRITIENKPNQITIKSKDGASIPKYLNWYLIDSGLLQFNKDGSREIKGKPIYVGTFKKYNDLSYYKLPAPDSPNTLEKDYFIRGNPLQPEYWIRCQQLGCQSSYQYNDDIVVNYFFRNDQIHFHKHDEIRKKISELVSKFNLKE